ncbi:MAG: insulinase family protein [Deltaproteobacteria bacterium]|jgi:predicted Zn-dependent peptidase|nr:insulinase family protein [Deltaproteobacteria bacterium]
MPKFIKFLQFIFLFLILTPSFSQAAAQTQEVQSEQTLQVLDNLKKNIQLITLSNGLRVVFTKRDTAPVFTGQIHVKVGGVNEPLGKSGVAHMLEHQAFKGTKVIGVTKDNEFGIIYNENGGVNLNAGTAKDLTYYTVSLPSNAFELWCWMESDRLLNPVFRQFDKERDVVLEERYMRVDNDPSGQLYEALLAVSFLSHPYRVPTIGWASEVSKLQLQDVQDFYAQYYRPDNMVISLVGNLEVETIKPLLERYFGRIPVKTSPLPQIITQEEPQRGERRIEVQFEAQPQFMIAYHKPSYPDPDDISFSLLHSILNQGRSSIFNQELVRDQKLALGVSTLEVPGSLYPSVFMVSAMPRNGVSNEQLISAIQQIFERLKTELVSAEVLAAAKRREQMDFLSLLETNDSLAFVLGQSELFYGDKYEFFKTYELILATTAEDLRKIARKYLNLHQRTIAEIK